MSDSGDGPGGASRKRKRQHESSHENNNGAQPRNHTKQALSFSVLGGDEQLKPVVVSSPGLSCKIKDDMKAYQRHKELLLCSSSHPKLDFVAQEESSGASENLMKHYLGIYDPKTGEVRAVPAKQLIMRTRLRDAQTLEDDVEAASQLTAYKARELLGEAFGTKKSKKALAALVENAVRSSQSSRTADGKLVLDTAASAVLDTMQAVTGTMSTQEALQQESDEGKPRPKMNLAAKNPAEVFSLDDLIGDDIMPLLDTRSWHADIKAGRNIQVPSAYVAHRITAVMRLGDSLRESKKDKILSYYLTLQQWLSSLQKGKREGWKLPKKEVVQETFSHVNERVMERIRRKFASQGLINRWAQGYLYTHLCAMALILDNFTVDLTDLQIDFGLERPELQKYFEELGCQPRAMSAAERARLGIDKARAAERRVMALSIPLRFPKLNVKRARR